MRSFLCKARENPHRILILSLPFLVSCFCILCSLVFFTPSAHAVNMTTLLQPTGRGLNTCLLSYTKNGNGTWVNVNANQAQITNFATIQTVRCNTGFNYKKDKVYEFKVLIKSRQQVNPIYFIWTALPPNDNWRLLSYEELFVDEAGSFHTISFGAICICSSNINNMRRFCSFNRSSTKTDSMERTGFINK